MTSLERNVKHTQWRLLVNEWFAAVGWCLLCGTVAWCFVVLADKLLGLSLALLYVFTGLAIAALAVSGVWAWLRRQDRVAAAAFLDEAAGLKERSSSSLFCTTSEDPFARAVIEDAEHVNSRISARSFVKFAWPSSLSFATVAVVVALIVTWLPLRPLQARDRNLVREDKEEFMREDVKRVKARLQKLQEQAKANPALKDMSQHLKTVDQLPVEKINTPAEARHEAIKNIDKLADAIRKTRNEKLDRMKELKRMFRGLKHTRQSKTPTDKLSKALSKGDFRAAQSAIKELREQLAKMTRNQDPKQREQMQKQIEKLAQQLQQLARQQQRRDEFAKQLQKSGLDPETAKRLLENLSKADLQKIKEQMKKQGTNEQQIKETMKTLKAQQKACQSCSSIAGAMQQAAQAMQSDATMGDAGQQLQMVGGMLSSMEQLEQQLNELDSMRSDAAGAQYELSAEQGGFCQNCGGGGCKACNGSGRRPGSGMGTRPGRGRGARAPEEKTGERWEKRRTPVITTKGTIIGKMFIDGEQVRGDVSSDAVELFSAAQREATDALEKNRIPNQYRGAVKEYFSEIVSELRGDQSSETESGNSNQDDSED